MKRAVLSAMLVLCCAAWGWAADWTRVVPSATVSLRDAGDLSVSAEGLLYIADTGHHRIVVVDRIGALVAETGGFGTAPGQFQWPRRVIANRGNAVWVLDYGNRRIEKFTRLLEYQGTLQITPSDAETRSQPEAMAMSPQGDLFVFDRDGGRLLRYDPLFNIQAELGRGSGTAFISGVSAMTFVPTYGLHWWTRGASTIERTDALLNPLPPLRIALSGEEVQLAATDSCLIWACARGVFEQCLRGTPADTLLTSEDLAAHGVQRITALAQSMDGWLYLLDGGANAVHRIRVYREPGE